MLFSADLIRSICLISRDDHILQRIFYTYINIYIYITVLQEAEEDTNYPNLSPVPAGFLWLFGFYSPARGGECHPDHP